MTRNSPGNDTRLTVDEALIRGARHRLPSACAAIESADEGGTMTAVRRLLDRVVCRYSTHDWWALAYPPARRWECRRCGLIAEEAPSSLPERRRVRRDRTKNVNGPSHS
jgi:hypothetical protein